jgi:hypothetical protein
MVTEKNNAVSMHVQRVTLLDDIYDYQGKT